MIIIIIIITTTTATIIIIIISTTTTTTAAIIIITTAITTINITIVSYLKSMNIPQSVVKLSKPYGQHLPETLLYVHYGRVISTMTCLLFNAVKVRQMNCIPHATPGLEAICKHMDTS